MSCIVGSASGAVPYIWYDWGADHDWSTAGNWFDGTGFTVPGSVDPTDYVLLGEFWNGPAVYGANQPVVTTVVPTVDFVGLSWMNAGPGEMTIEAGGSLSTSTFFIIGHSTSDTDGVLTMNGGALNVGAELQVGNTDGHGTLLMNDGVINITNPLYINNGGTTGSGLVELAGGTINAANLSMGGNAVLNITGGTLITAFDWSGINGLSDFIGIQAYGGTGTIVAIWDGTNPYLCL